MNTFLEYLFQQVEHKELQMDALYLISCRCHTLCSSVYQAVLITWLLHLYCYCHREKTQLQ